jgi:hypothetical protein
VSFLLSFGAIWRKVSPKKRRDILTAAHFMKIRRSYILREAKTRLDQYALTNEREILDSSTLCLKCAHVTFFRHIKPEHTCFRLRNTCNICGSFIKQMNQPFLRCSCLLSIAKADFWLFSKNEKRKHI